MKISRLMSDTRCGCKWFRKHYAGLMSRTKQNYAYEHQIKMTENQKSLERSQRAKLTYRRIKINTPDFSKTIQEVWRVKVIQEDKYSWLLQNHTRSDFSFGCQSIKVCQKGRIQQLSPLQKLFLKSWPEIL